MGGIYRIRESRWAHCKKVAQRRWRWLKRQLGVLTRGLGVLGQRVGRLGQRLGELQAIQRARSPVRRPVRGGPYWVGAIGGAAVSACLITWWFGHWLDREPPTRFMTLNGHGGWVIFLTIVAIGILAVLVIPTEGFKSATSLELAGLWLAGALTLVSALGYFLAAMVVAFLAWRLIR